MVITREYIHRYKTINGGWTRSQIEALGLTWGDLRNGGWINKAIGNIISLENQLIFEAAKPSKSAKHKSYTGESYTIIKPTRAEKENNTALTQYYGRTIGKDYKEIICDDPPW